MTSAQSRKCAARSSFSSPSHALCSRKELRLLLLLTFILLHQLRWHGLMAHVG